MTPMIDDTGPQTLAAIAALIAEAPADSDLRQRAAKGGFDPSGPQGAMLDGAALARIPRLHKRDLAQRQQAPGGLAAMLPFGGLAAARRVYRSPGGTLDFEGEGPDFWGFGGYVRRTGIGAGDIAVVALSFQGTPGGFMFDEGLRAAGATVFPAGTMGSDDLLALMEELRATCFVGIPSHLMALLRKAEETERSLLQGVLRHALLAGEKLTPEVRACLAKRGITAWQAYGTADLGMVASECHHHAALHLRKDVHVEICDPETGAPLALGQTGEVVVSLTRRVYPMLRLATGDLSAFALHDSCPCGHQGRSLVGILGRTDSLTKVRGMFIHPSDVAALAQSQGLEGRLRILVTGTAREDRITLLVAPGTECDPSTLEAQFRKFCALRGNAVMGESHDFAPGLALIEDRRG